MPITTVAYLKTNLITSLKIKVRLTPIFGPIFHRSIIFVKLLYSKSAYEF